MADRMRTMVDVFIPAFVVVLLGYAAGAAISWCVFGAC